MTISFFANPPDPAVAEYWQQLIATRGRETLVRPPVPEGLEAFAALYAPFVVEHDGPMVVAQLGQSLDGFIATEAGASHYITGPESLVHLHRLRALCDAVVVGSGTVEADDPQLTVRHVPGQSPLRVVLDPTGRVAPDRKVFAQDDAGCLHITHPDVRPVTEAAHLTIGAGESFAKSILEALAARGCRRILIEGGGVTVSRMIAEGLVDRLHLAIAPLILGAGRRGLGLPAYTDLSKAPRPEGNQMPMGRDVLFDLDLRRV